MHEALAERILQSCRKIDAECLGFATDANVKNALIEIGRQRDDLLAACKMQMERLQARLPKDTYATVDEWIDAALAAPATTQIRKDAEAANAIRRAISRATGETP